MVSATLTLVLLASGGQADFAFPLKPDSVRLAVIGDMGTGEQPQIDTAQQMMRSRAVFPFEFVLTVGDNIYTGSQPSDFERAFVAPYKALLDAGVTFYATLGNHDNSNQRFYKPFNMNGAAYYTFKKGHVRFFALDTTYMDQRQTAWLETKLREAGNGDWKICYFHHALYSSARYHGSARGLRKVLEPLFVKYGVDVVFAGHDHVYERVRPQQGIYHFTEGASGSLRAADLAPSAITAKGFDADRSFMLVEFAGDDMYFETVSRTGVAVDSGVIRRTIPAGGRRPPRYPQGLAHCTSRWPGHVISRPMGAPRRAGVHDVDAQSLLDPSGVAKNVVAYGRSETLFSQGDAADSVVDLRQGGVKLSVVANVGREAIVAMLGPDVADRGRAVPEEGREARAGEARAGEDSGDT